MKTISFSIITLALFLPLIGWGQSLPCNNPTFVKSFNEGQAQYKKGDYKNALLNLTLAGNICPKCNDCKVMIKGCNEKLKAEQQPIIIKKTDKDPKENIVSQKIGRKFSLGYGLYSFRKQDKWGIVDALGKVILAPNYYDIKEFNEKGIAFIYGEKSGYIDKNRKITLAYNFLDYFSGPISYDPYYKASIRRKYGCLDNAGKIIIPFMYDTLYNEQSADSSFVVKLNGKYGILNHINKQIAPIKFDSIIAENGIYRLRLHKKWGIANSTTVGELKYDTLFKMQRGVMVVKIGNKSGLVDDKLNELLPVIYEKLGYIISNGPFYSVLLVEQNGLKAFYSINKKKLTPFYDKINYTRADGNETTRMVSRNDKFGFVKITDDGKDVEEIIPTIYDKGTFPFIKPTYSGDPYTSMSVTLPDSTLAFDLIIGKHVSVFADTHYGYGNATEQTRVCNNGKFGIINRLGQIVLPVVYDDVFFWENSQNPFIVKKGEKWGIVDSANKRLTSFIFDLLSAFDDSCSIYRIGNNHGLVDKRGKVLVSELSHIVRYTTGFYIITTLNNKMGLIDFKGNYLIKPTHQRLYYLEGTTLISENDNKFNLYTISGQKLTSEDFDWIYPEFIENRTPCKKRGKYGYLDQTGKIAIECLYQKVSSFADKKALVQKDGQTFYIDVNGNCVQDCPGTK